MKGLSNDIEEAVKIVIQGLEYPIDASEVDPDKLTTVIQSKTDSFIEGKKLILDWQQSENAPSHTKLKKYLRRLVDAGDSSMSILRMSLREEIDYDNLAPEKHKKAIASKTIILKGIRTMDNGLIELRNQIESDKINLKENEFKKIVLKSIDKKVKNGLGVVLDDVVAGIYTITILAAIFFVLAD